MKNIFGFFGKIIYTIVVGSQHMDVLGEQWGVDGPLVIAMDRLISWFLAGNRCRMSA